MTIPFIFVLTWFIPEAKGLSKSEITSLVESARQSSIPRIRRYAGYALMASFFLPAILFSSVFIGLFIGLGIAPSEMPFIFAGLMGLMGLLSALSNQLLTCIFNTLILKPAIYDQLNRKPQPLKPSV